MIQAEITLLEELISKSHATIEAHKEELTALDQAIGDGDHGLNIARGFAALEEKKSEIVTGSFPEICKKAGMALVMSVGGASGPLFGSCLMGFGKAADQFPKTQSELAAMLVGGVEAVKARGKSDAGAKTMLDVLIPVLDKIQSQPDLTIADVRDSAHTALAATKDILATKGRAAFLGKRSIGHIDPGARSTALLIEVICEVLETQK